MPACWELVSDASTMCMAAARLVFLLLLWAELELPHEQRDYGLPFMAPLVLCGLVVTLNLAALITHPSGWGLYWVPNTNPLVSINQRANACEAACVVLAAWAIAPLRWHPTPPSGLMGDMPGKEERVPADGEKRRPRLGARAARDHAGRARDARAPPGDD